MATITYTPNLNLKVSSDDDAITKYNLNRIDYLAQKISIAVNGNTQLTSSTDVFIGAVYGLGVNRFNGTITLDAGNLGALDTASKVQVNARNFTVHTDGGTITLDAGSIDLGGIALDNYLLADGNILVGSASNKAVAVPVSGDITLSNDGTMTLNIDTVGTGKIQDGAVTTDKIAADTIVDANISPSAAISYSKLNITGQVVNDDISGSAAIEQSKILGLTSALSGKEPTLTKGDLTATPASAITISNGSNVLIGNGTSIVLNKADAATDGYLSKEDYATFASSGVVTEDLLGVTGRTVVTNGSNVLVDNSATVDVDTDLLPSPEAGDVGKALLATGENTASWSVISTADEKIKISATDTTAGYLETKIAAGTGIAVAIEDSGGNEYISVENTDTGSAAVSTHESTYVHADIAHTNRSSLDLVSGTNTGDETGSSIVTALGYTPANIAGDTFTGQVVLDNQGIKFNITDDYVGTPAEGTLWWNKEDHTINVKSDIAAATLQLGLENWLRAKNDTASSILEGAVVYIKGANTARPTIELAQANSATTSDKVIGVVTDTIAAGALGIVTTFGLVRDLTTNVDGDGSALVDGQCVYLSATTAGEWVGAKPHAPNHCVKIGQIVNAAAGNAGNLFVAVDTGTHLQDLHDVNVETALADNQVLQYNSSTGIWDNVTLSHTDLSSIGTNTHAQIDTQLATTAAVLVVEKEPTGFVNRTDSVLTFTGAAARELSISPAVTSYKVWIKAVEYTISSTKSKQVTDTNGAWYFYFDTNLDLQAVQNFTEDLLHEYALVAMAYWDKTNSAWILTADERHGCVMDWQTHLYLHTTRGAVASTMPALTGFTIVTNNSTTLASIQQYNTGGTLNDEDLTFSVGAAASATSYPMFYRKFETGIGACYRRDLPDATPNFRNFIYNGRIGYTAAANRIAYNALTPTTTTNHVVEAASNGEVILSHFFFTDDTTYPIIIIPGYASYASAATAAAAASGEVYNIVTSTAVPFPFKEMVWIGSVLFQTSSSYSVNSFRARVAQPSAGVNYVASSLASTSAITLTTPTVAPRYVTAITWTGAGPYTFSITGVTHAKGLEPIIRVRAFSSGTTYDVVDVDVAIDETNGNVTLTSTENFVGKVVIL
jgi:hypothetical protein